METDAAAADASNISLRTVFEAATAIAIAVARPFGGLFRYSFARCSLFFA